MYTGLERRNQTRTRGIITRILDITFQQLRKTEGERVKGKTVVRNADGESVPVDSEGQARSLAE